MSPQNEARPRGGSEDRAECSLLDGRNEPEISPAPRRRQAQNRLACPIILTSHCRLTADLLAESVEFAIAYGIGVLRAARESDNPGILENFKHFDCAARCARKCATELRNLLDAGRAQ